MALNIPGLKSEEQKNHGGVNINDGGEPSDFQFYNVMPKNMGPGEIIDPKIVSAETEEPAKIKKTFKQLYTEHKLYFILGAVVVIAGPIIYFIFSEIIKHQYQQQTLINKNVGLVKKPTPTPTPVSQQTGFTTSKDWRDKYFPNCNDISLCGDAADPDNDGLTNLQEFKAGTDPNNPDSDQDGLADGDELNVFGSDPLKNHTANNDKYSDLDYVKGGFSFTTSKLLSSADRIAVGAKMKSFGLHEPTISSLGNILNSMYYFSAGSDSTTTPELNSSSTPGQIPDSTTTPQSVDQSLSAKQSRDTQRSNTILNIEKALVAYQSDNKNYPDSPDFDTMFLAIKPYIRIATNPKDPIGIDPYLYSYSPSATGTDFTLTFYSEVASGPISKHAVDAQKDISSENAQTNDNQREFDLENLRTALLLYANATAAGNQTYVFPTLDKYKTALVPNYIMAIPKDPVTGKDYDYEPSSTFDTFTLKTTLQSPPAGNTGYICNQIEDCHYY